MVEDKQALGVTCRGLAMLEQVCRLCLIPWPWNDSFVVLAHPDCVGAAWELACSPLVPCTAEYG